MLNDIQNGFPVFRTMPAYVANQRLNGYTTDPDAEIVRRLPSVTTQDVMDFHRQHIGNNQSRVWIVIGDRKRTNKNDLARFGKVVELRKDDVYR